MRGWRRLPPARRHRLHEFAGAGHLAPVTHAAAVNALLAAHIEASESAAR